MPNARYFCSQPGTGGLSHLTILILFDLVLVQKTVVLFTLKWDNKNVLAHLKKDQMSVIRQSNTDWPLVSTHNFQILLKVLKSVHFIRIMELFQILNFFQALKSGITCRIQFPCLAMFCSLHTKFRNYCHGNVVHYLSCNKLNK